jgi:phage terminase large subunit-like protein
VTVAPAADPIRHHLADLRHHLADLRSIKTRRATGRTVEEESVAMAASFPDFIRGAWPWVVPQPLVSAWHIDVIAEHVAAAYNREITRLLVTVPPGSLKSTIVSVLGPAWRWASHPEERFASASWHEPLAVRDTRKSRMLMQSPWYQARWPTPLARDENLKGRYSNTVGGHRVATHVGGGTGERGDVLLLDDPHNAQEAQTENQMRGAIDWWGDTWSSRMNDSVDRPGVKMVIGQRIHEDDLIGHILHGDEDAGLWVHLCLPARYERVHPYLYPKKRKLPSGRALPGDPRTQDRQLLAPEYTSEERLAELEREMTTHVAAGQLQQRPTAREGDLLKRAWWRYYPQQQPDETFGQLVARLPKSRVVLQSWDTPLKEKETNDLIAGQCWGALGGDRFLLDSRQGHMNYSAARRAVLDMARWARETWPNATHRILIEKGGYGIDLIRDLQREITGVVQIPEKGERLPDKYARAESASADLESGNVFLPGYPLPNMTGPDEARCPDMTTSLVATCAAFPQGRYKDPVDSWSQAMNWLRKRAGGTLRSSVPEGRIGMPRQLPGRL